MGMKGVEIDNLKVSDPSNPDDPLQIDLDATANNYFDWSAPESKMSLPFMQIGLPPEGDAEDDDQTHPKPIKLGAIGESSVDVRSHGSAEVHRTPADRSRGQARLRAVWFQL